jgi:hypothetical protein
VSPDGFNNFKIEDPAIDERTKPTGKFGEYAHNGIKMLLTGFLAKQLSLMNLEVEKKQGK